MTAQNLINEFHCRYGGLNPSILKVLNECNRHAEPADHIDGLITKFRNEQAAVAGGKKIYPKGVTEELTNDACTALSKLSYDIRRLQLANKPMAEILSGADEPYHRGMLRDALAPEYWAEIERLGDHDPEGSLLEQRLAVGFVCEILELCMNQPSRTGISELKNLEAITYAFEIESKRRKILDQKLES